MKAIKAMTAVMMNHIILLLRMRLLTFPLPDLAPVPVRIHDPVRHSSRPRKPSEKANEAATGAKVTKVIDDLIPDEPHSLEEALSSPDSSHWCKAIIEELDSLWKHQTFHLVPRTNQKTIDTKWYSKSKITNFFYTFSEPV